VHDGLHPDERAAAVVTGKRLHRGLDLDSVDATTPEEIEAFRAELLESLGGREIYPLTAYSLMLETRPDMLKLHFRQMQSALGGHRILAVLTMLHWYTCHRWEEGIAHEVRNAQVVGASKAQVEETLALAFVHGGPSAMGAVHRAALDELRAYEEPAQPAVFPDGWAPDPAALRSGMDFSEPAMSAADEQALFGWYERTIGEVPRSVRFLARNNPDYLKAWRAKLEGALRGALPKQLLPYVLIHSDVNRGFADGIREAVLLGRAWGMTKADVVHAITFATGYMAGIDALYVVDDAVGELLERWDTSGSTRPA
jgi:hypothetical protein